MDSSCYSESELCGGAVTVSFFEVPPLANNELLTTLHPLFENVLQTVCLKLQENTEAGSFDHGAPFSWLEKPRNLMGRGLDCMADVLMGFHRSRWVHLLPHFSRATLTLHWGCSTIPKCVLLNDRNSVFKKWVEHCKKCIACQGRYSEKETVTAPPQSSDSE
jgi:hypothetical protein